MLLKIEEHNYLHIKKQCRYKQYFQFFNVALVLNADNKEVLEIFEIMYQNFIVHVQQTHLLECFIIKNPLNEHKPIIIIEERVYSLFKGELFISHAHMLIFQAIIENIDGYFLIHAGLVAKNGRGIIIAGPSGYGKTTLMLELVSRGHTFFSDEFCPVKLEDFTLESFPRSLGVRESSPFIKYIKNKPRLREIKNIGRGKKYLINCNDIFPNSIGTRCSAKHLIFLRGSFAEGSIKTRNIVDIALFKHNQKFVDEISKPEGIAVKEIFNESNYIVYRFSVENKTGLSNTLYDVCDQYKDCIFYQEQIPAEQPIFTNVPSLHNITKHSASIELLKLIRNRSMKSRLLKRFNYKNTMLLITLGNFIKNVECYEMQLGPLKTMADIIENL